MHVLADFPAQRALTASTIALAVAVSSVALFLPPWAERTTDSVLRSAATALALALALMLHWAFLGIAARRLGRTVAGWVAPAVLLFPIGGAAALILLGWMAGERAPVTPAPHRG